MKTVMLAVALATAATSAFAYTAPNAYDNSTVSHPETRDFASVTPDTTVNPEDVNGSEKVWIVPLKRLAPEGDELLEDFLGPNITEGKGRASYTPDTTVNPEDPTGTEQVWIVPFKR